MPMAETASASGFKVRLLSTYSPKFIRTEREGFGYGGLAVNPNASASPPGLFRFTAQIRVH